MPMLALSAILLKVILPIEGVAFIASLTDPEWAAPINTALLILLTLIAAANGARAKRVGVQVEEARQEVTVKVDNAASAAASAADAAAIAARIAQEAGGQIRAHREVREGEAYAAGLRGDDGPPKVP